VYRFRDARGRVLYIGRASDLRSRVRSYWTQRDDRRTTRLAQLVCRVEAVVCDSEHEAAWLERNLLEHGLPRWNKTAGGQEVPVFIRLDAQSRTPSVAVVHTVLDAPHVRYFGPYLGGLKVRTAVAGLHRVSPLAFCGEAISGSERDMARLRGVGPADREPISDAIARALAREPIAVADIRQALIEQRERATDSLQFERAAAIQAELDALAWVVVPQRVTTLEPCSNHVYGWSAGTLVHFEICGGRLCVWRQRPCTEHAAKPRLNVTPEPWRNFAHRSAELAARLTN
jgi:excinuclease ABC subunit C